MKLTIPLAASVEKPDFTLYEKQFKALADQKRLHLLSILCQQGASCVCDLTDILNLTQSKLSYHLKILLDADIITKEKRGTWNYYSINSDVINHLLSEELCCLLRPAE
ncbi:metalloregulator ArsR/SmtB family transcription factor [Alkalihalophilus marmarensis]|jgi:ArsR family transcriptional regulator|uniref:ArsR family transcriptional regulator n=1 Tax=Alkalihalophilus marmarensis DSM 21297 TaxID=1188261 RepID=U6SPQ7_9BACI|nr:metalloregulator ArsR/SmtB family transcription factor [Alkalihalophilus marmarensis]ERN52641.1 ArsR family transcriptional regulator [Alkalihalophilus marmarensis DSM 21297]MCM3487981.1 metalloregulator ArsR/SmtB family transcription factor [Alkalihalophilus marmarensis]